MRIDLTGKTALVTGASRGIGKACALALAEAGADVMVNFRRSGAQAEAVRDEIIRMGRDAVAFEADVSETGPVDALFDRLSEWRGRLDILVYNAGIIRDGLLGAMGFLDWDRVLSVNLRGAFLCARAATAFMVPRHAGKIVNVASITAVQCVRGQSNYAASKGGLVSFTRACAVELAPKGIQVNAVLPGMIVTDMSARARQRAGEEILKRIPLGRFGEPEDVARTVVFLASPLADYITGQALGIDGGMSVGG